MAPASPLRRLERAEDALFLFELFRDAHDALLAGLDPALRDVLLRQQCAGQTMTYRARYPRASFDIVEHDRTAIGRIVEDRASNAITIVDIALVASWRGRGIGTQLLRDCLAFADAVGLPARLRVGVGNSGARRLYERLGFAVVARTDVDLAMERPGRTRDPHPVRDT